MRPSAVDHDRLLEEVREGARGRRPEDAPYEVRRTVGAWRVVLRLRDADRLGTLLEELEATPPESGGGELEERARRVLDEVKALGPLALHEIEPALGRAVLRSASPRLRPEGIEYDEALLEEGRGLRIRRWRFERGSSRRRPVPANLAAEALPHLLDDLARALRS